MIYMFIVFLFSAITTFMITRVLMISRQRVDAKLISSYIDLTFAQSRETDALNKLVDAQKGQLTIYSQIIETQKMLIAAYKEEFEMDLHETTPRSQLN